MSVLQQWKKGGPTIEAHGVRVPKLGLGTWELRGAVVERIVERALELGYRHIDTAEAYGNEEAIGRALERSGLDREVLFLTTKVWPDSYPDVSRAAERSLRRLRTDRVDLLLLHWPRFHETSLEAVVEVLVEARERGLARHIGVSNFTAELVSRAWEIAGTPLVANQVEYHPFLDQTPVLEAVRERGMVLTAYSPLAKGRVVRDDTLREIGRRHGKTAAQVALRWLLGQDRVAAIPRTSDPDHLAQNLDAFDFELDADEIRTISGLSEPGGRLVDPEGLAPEWD